MDGTIICQDFFSYPSLDGPLVPFVLDPDTFSTGKLIPALVALPPCYFELFLNTVCHNSAFLPKLIGEVPLDSSSKEGVQVDGFHAQSDAAG